MTGLSPLDKTANMFKHYSTNAFGDRYFHVINGSVFATDCANDIYYERYGEDLFNENTAYIFMGTDSALLVHYIHQHQVKGSRYIFIELPEVIEALHAHRLLPQPLGEDITVCEPNQWADAAKNYTIELFSYTNNVQLYSSLGTADAFLADYTTMVPILHKEIYATVIEHRRSLLRHVFIKPILQNTPHNIQPAALLKHAFPGKTAVILGGGPSLDEYLPWVTKNRTHLVVLAVSRISRRLLELNFKPDIVFSVDPYDVSFEVSKSMLRFDHVLFIHANHVNTRLLSQYKGKTAYLGPKYPWRTKDNAKNIDMCPPTVANSAINAAVEFGFVQVILIGVDLCFSPAGFSHAKGSNEYETGPVWGHNNQSIETNSGRMAETSTHFFLALQPMANTATQAKQRGIRIINPVPYAAKLLDVEHIPVTDIVLVPLDEPAQTTIDRAIPPLTNALRTADRKATIATITKTKIQLQAIKQLANIAIASLTILTDSKASAQVNKQHEKLDQIDATLKQEYSSTIEFMKQYAMCTFMKIVDPSFCQKIEFNESIEKSRLLFHAYIETADTLIHFISEVLCLIKSRIMEDNDTPDFENLCQQWQHDNQLGRVMVWQYQHLEAAKKIPDTIRQTFQSYQFDFEQELNRPSTHTQYIKDKTGLARIRTKARHFFKQKNTSGLKDLLTSLAYCKAVEDSVYEILIHAYLADLNDNHLDALALYDQINLDKLKEDAYPQAIRLLLTKEQYTKALEYFEVLHQLTPIYQVQYADLLRLTGKIQESIDMYTDYLQRMPEDLDTLMKLGKLYHSMNIPEASKWAFNHIAKAQPNNHEALHFLDELNKRT